MSLRPAVHLAIPVDDLDGARQFYGGVLGLREGRSTSHWVDWDLHGHQLVTHAAPDRSAVVGSSMVDGHAVPVSHYGLLLSTEEFHTLADRLRAAGTAFVIEPYRRFPGKPAEQWTMFLHDPAGNALEFKAFRDESKIFTR
ncbi:VOC family protein [Streptomyces sp. SID3343]|uniref:VOC family protein n=1 Tax=Streptomyces sp. SID3343 TaxID=2690260 RepID=UPI00136D4D2C|nr:VOC family protein [Streptomyces sp. SID3343]MYV99940.1 glyoxalase [Streptomyces sp. SID3343]